MAVRNRRYTFAAIALPFLLIAMTGLARANTIIVNTLDAGSDAFPLCTLEDAVLAAETGVIHGGCPAGTGTDTIEFIVTGTISPANTLTINNTNEVLTISGPTFGCSGAGPCGIVIDGGQAIELIDAVDAELLLENLTLADGSNFAGGALLAGSSIVGIENCTFLDNRAEFGGALAAQESIVFLLNDTFTGNSAAEGGAIDNASEMLVSNNTFSENLAAEGAGIFTDLGETDVNSTILANSFGSGNCANVTDDGYNISDDTSCGFSGTSVDNSTTLNLDTLGLQNNGGPTQTIALKSGSQAIDFIPIASCFTFLDAPVTNDQRLFARPDSDGGVPESFCDAGAYESGAVAPIVLAPKTERVQIARSSATNSDQVNMAFTFIYNGDPDCDVPTGGDEDALNSGVGVALFGGTCAALPSSGLILYLDPFSVHKVNKQQYGSLFQVLGNETVSARMVALPAPTGACGAWALNLEVAGLDTKAMGLGGTGPFALVVTDLDGDQLRVGIAAQALTLADILGDAAGCFDITNAVVGNQIPTPGHGVRRRVRR